MLLIKKIPMQRSIQFMAEGFEYHTVSGSLRDSDTLCLFPEKFSVKPIIFDGYYRRLRVVKTDINKPFPSSRCIRYMFLSDDCVFPVSNCLSNRLILRISLKLMFFEMVTKSGTRSVHHQYSSHSNKPGITPKLIPAV